MLCVAGALAPSAITRTDDGLKAGDGALKALEDTVSTVVTNLAVTKRVAAELADTLVYLGPQYDGDVTLAFKLQKAMTAVQRMLLTIDETTHFMEMVETFETRDEAKLKLSVLTAFTWMGYVALAVAALAPISAHFVPKLPEGVLGDAGRHTTLNVIYNLPFVSLLYTWLFLAVLSPLTVIGGESCHEWVPMVLKFLPEDMHYWFFCGGAQSEAALDPAGVALSPFLPAWRDSYTELQSTVKGVLAFSPAAATQSAAAAQTLLLRLKASDAEMVTAHTVAAAGVYSCDPVNSMLVKAKDAFCADLVTGLLWHGVALAVLAFIVFYHVLRGWCVEAVEEALGFQIFAGFAGGGGGGGGGSVSSDFAGKYGSGGGGDGSGGGGGVGGFGDSDLESQKGLARLRIETQKDISTLRGEVGVVAGDVKHVKDKVDELVPLMQAAYSKPVRAGVAAAAAPGEEGEGDTFKGKKWSRG